MLASTREDEAHGGPVDAGFGHALFRNNHSSSRHRLKAQTLQTDGRLFLMHKYFSDQAENPISPLAPPTTYANVPPDQCLPMTPILPLHHQQGPPAHHQAHHGHHHSRQQSRHSHRSHNHQHLHARSHSQHYYQSMLSQGLNELNCYYNMPHGLERSRHSPIINHEPLPPPPPMHSLHNQPVPMDQMTILQVCNEMYTNIDSLPPMPASRKYSILRTQGVDFKVAFPQTRTMKVDYHDQATKTTIKAGETISVLEPSKEDRSKFSICYKDKHIDLPHQFTQAAPIRFNLYYNQGYVDSHNSPMRHQLPMGCQTNSKRCM